MSRRKLVYLLTALDDLDQIGRESDALWGRRQTRSYLRSIRDTAKNLLAFPGTGADCSDIRPGYRRKRAGVHHIFYKLTEDEVQIVRILHERQDAASQLQ